MSDEQNIEGQKTDDSPQPTENENISEPTAINDPPLTNKEVHKHTHHVTYKKKWTDICGILYVVSCRVSGVHCGENQV